MARANWRRWHIDVKKGIYAVRSCKGYLAVSLPWADKRGPLDDWTVFAYVPLDADGNGVFRYTGGRAVPPEATHIYVKGITADFEPAEGFLLKLPSVESPAESGRQLSFLAMSDLHLAAKAGTVCHALRTAKDYPFLLITGDLTDSGWMQTYRRLKWYIQKEAPDLPIFTVAGNHDYYRMPYPVISEDVWDYASFQEWLRKRNLALGFQWKQDVSGAYVVRMGEVEVIGLSEMTHWRRFISKGGAQIQWLERYLAQSEARRHIIMCHAPLRAHNAKRTKLTDEPYLLMDKKLQEILDRHGNILFLSGHTHLSPNILQGCVEHDTEHNNIYIDNGSIHPTDMLGESPAPAEWKAGVMTEIRMSPDMTEITMRQHWTGKKIARGYYRLANSGKNE